MPLELCSWREDDVPLAERGVRISWLYDFVISIYSAIDGLWGEYYTAYEIAKNNDRFASDRNPNYSPEDIKWPDQPVYSRPLTTSQLVSLFIVPLTSHIKAPLYARIPPEHRGCPSKFISHTWSSYTVQGAHGTLDMVKDHDHDSFAWIDIVCYNQHRVQNENIYGDMKEIISRIGQIAFVLTPEPFFTRSWCLWEIVCAHQTKTKVSVYNQIARIQKKYWSSEKDAIPKKFKSITNLSAIKQHDKDKIFKLLVSTFGSVHQADEYIHSILPQYEDNPRRLGDSR